MEPKLPLNENSQSEVQVVAINHRNHLSPQLAEEIALRPTTRQSEDDSIEPVSAPRPPGGHDLSQLNTDIDTTTETTEQSPLRPSSLITPDNEIEAGVMLEPRWRQYRGSLSLFTSTLIWVSLSIVYAFLASSSHPPLEIFPSADMSIWALAFLSNGSVLLLSQLLRDAYNNLRWTMAARSSGVGVLTFLGLGAGTGLNGLFRLIRSKQNVGHHKWIVQRLVHLLFILAIGIVLLFNLNFEMSYRRTAVNDPIIAGTAPFNISLLSPYEPNISILPMIFMFSLRGLLRDPKTTAPFPPYTPSCQNAGDDCFSYIWPGELDQVTLLNGTVGTPEDFSDNQRNGATWYITEGVPSYHLEYFPVVDNVVFNGSDCQVFGKYVNALKICLKNVGDDLIAGWTTCPPELSNAANECFTKPDAWGKTINATTQLHVWSIYTIAAFDIKSSSIQSVSVALNDSRTSVLYPSDDIFKVLKIALDSSQDTITNIHTSTQLILLLTNIIQVNSLQGRKSALEYDLLRTILALPLYLVNLGKMEPDGTNWRPPKDMYVTGFLAKDVYRVIIGKHTLYVFTALALVLLAWAGVVLIYCYRGDEVPNLSDFDGVDFATKCGARLRNANDKTMGDLLDNLGNGRSCDVVKRVKGRRMFLGVASSDENDEGAADIKESGGSVSLFTNPPEVRLEKQKSYT